MSIAWIGGTLIGLLTVVPASPALCKYAPSFLPYRHAEIVTNTEASADPPCIYRDVKQSIVIIYIYTLTYTMVEHSMMYELIQWDERFSRLAGRTSKVRREV